MMAHMDKAAIVAIVGVSLATFGTVGLLDAHHAKQQLDAHLQRDAFEQARDDCQRLADSAARDAGLLWGLNVDVEGCMLLKQREGRLP